MDLADLEEFCGNWKAVTTDIKWGDHLVYSVHGKMFLIVDKSDQHRYATFKVDPEDFDTMAAQDVFRPAPYLARYNWINMENRDLIRRDEFEELVKESYLQVISKMSKKLRGQCENFED